MKGSSACVRACVRVGACVRLLAGACRYVRACGWVGRWRGSESLHEKLERS